MRVDTRVSESNPKTGYRTYKLGEDGIHLSPIILIFSPLPTLHIRPCSSIALELKMLLQVKDGFLLRFASKKEEFG
jgi:hypothetical protein